jgi:hypothetical protein
MEPTQDPRGTASNHFRAIAGACALAIALGGMCVGSAHAQRYVIVNGQLLTEPQIQELERLGCVSIPNGSYWLRNDGLWGYAGDPNPQGQVGQYCGHRQRSLSERGLLYSPGELLSPYR